MQPPLLLLPLLWAGSLAQDDRFRLDVPESVTVQEGLCVTVPCRLSHPESRMFWLHHFHIHGSWYKEEAEHDTPVAANHPERTVQETRGRFFLSGIPGPTAPWTSETRRGGTRAHLTQTPDIHIWGTLESGRPQNITCAVPWACKRGTPPTFSWIGVALSSLVPQTPLSSVLTLTPGPQHHGTNLTCRVTLPGSGVTMERTIQLNVSYAPRNLTILVFRGSGTVPEVLDNATSLRVQEGESLRLVCRADSSPPARLSWTQGSLTGSHSPPLEPGVLELPQVTLGNVREFTCQAQHPLGSRHASLSLAVQGLSCPQLCGEQRGSWPLVLTLLRGALMGAGFLLTYVLTWAYYARCGGPPRALERTVTKATSRC